MERRSRNRRRPALGAVFLCSLFFSAVQGYGADAFSTKAPAAVLMDAASGEVLFEANSHARLPPASMVKMMVGLIVMEKLKDGSLHLDEEVAVSAKAAKMGGSQVYLKQGEVFTVEQMMKAIMIHSANDASAAVAEHIAGSTESFVDLMNLRAKELGMQDTEFHSVHGLPPGRGQQMDLTSAHDMALLGRALVEYPKVLEWTSTVEEPFRDGKFLLHNTNRLLTRYKGMDGIKTGYIRQSGFCITATAARDSTRMIAVVMGTPNNATRAAETTRLLTLGFSSYKSVKLAGKGQAAKERLPVKGGKAKDLGLRYAADLSVSVKTGKTSEVVVKEELPASVPAPVYEGDAVGKAVALLGDQVLKSVDLVAAETVEKGSFFDRLFR